jgi:hypothetical protein
MKISGPHLQVNILDSSLIICGDGYEYSDEVFAFGIP